MKFPSGLGGVVLFGHPAKTMIALSGKPNEMKSVCDG